MSIEHLVIVGVGGQGRELHQLVEDINIQGLTAGEGYEVLGWLDSNPDAHGTQVHGLPVLGDLEWLAHRPHVGVVVGIGSPHVRRCVVEGIQAQGPNPMPALIHPSAIIGDRVQIGEGTYVCAGVVITTDCNIGRHVLLNTGCILTHDDNVSDFATIAPRATICGNVTVGEGTEIGAGATVLQGVSVGEWSIVGGAALVRSELPANCTAVGVPAQPIKQREPAW